MLYARMSWLALWGLFLANCSLNLQRPVETDGGTDGTTNQDASQTNGDGGGKDSDENPTTDAKSDSPNEDGAQSDAMTTDASDSGNDSSTTDQGTLDGTTDVNGTDGAVDAFVDPTCSPVPCVTTFAGSGPCPALTQEDYEKYDVSKCLNPDPKGGALLDAQFHAPLALAVYEKQGEPRRVFVVDSYPGVLREIVGGQVNTVISSTPDLYDVHGLVADPARNALYVTSFHKHRIYKIDLKNKYAMTVLVGNGFAGSKNGAALQVELSSPRGISLSLDGKKLYIADAGNHQIRVFDFGTNQVSTIAGAGIAGGLDNIAAAATFNEPNNVIEAPDGALYVADKLNQSVRKISGGKVTTVVTGLSHPVGVLVATHPDSKNVLKPHLFVTEYGYNFGLHRIIGFPLEDPLGKSVIAGSGTQGYKDGSALQAEFNHLYGITMDSEGRVYVAEHWNHRIRLLILK